MCYTIALDPKLNKQSLHIAGKQVRLPFTKPEIKGFDHAPHPIITANSADEPQMMSWGLVPAWVGNLDKAKEMRVSNLNARIETAAELPSFKAAYKSQRCLVPVTAFYEWQHKGKDKLKHYINLKDTDVFCLAGIYDTWLSPLTGTATQSFAILTTAANELMAEIHNTKLRMPVILTPAQEFAWLNQEIDKPEAYPTASMQALPLGQVGLF